MTLYDSSVLIDYLGGESDVVDYVEANLHERAIAPPVVLFEVYQGEVYRSGPADFDAVSRALEWVDTVETTSEHALTAAELQAELHDQWEPLTARDALIAGIAASLGERLAVSDSDFEAARRSDRLDIDLL